MHRPAWPSLCLCCHVVLLVRGQLHGTWKGRWGALAAQVKAEKISSLQAEQRQLREQAGRQADQLARLEAQLSEMAALREELQQALQARAELQGKLQLAIQEVRRTTLHLVAVRCRGLYTPVAMHACA